MKKDELKKAGLAVEKGEELADDALDEVAGGVMSDSANRRNDSISGLPGARRPITGAVALGGNNASTQGVAGKSGLIDAGVAGIPSVSETQGKPGVASKSGIDTNSKA